VRFQTDGGQAQWVADSDSARWRASRLRNKTSQIDKTLIRAGLLAQHMELTPSKKKSQARNHHLAGLYHNAFIAGKSTPTVGADVSADHANKLVRAGWAHLNVFGTKVVISQTKTGASKYGSNCLLNGVHQIPRYSRNDTVDISNMMNELCRYSNRYLTKWW